MRKTNNRVHLQGVFQGVVTSLSRCKIANIGPIDSPFLKIPSGIFDCGLWFKHAFNFHSVSIISSFEKLPPPCMTCCTHIRITESQNALCTKTQNPIKKSVPLLIRQSKSYHRQHPEGLIAPQNVQKIPKCVNQTIKNPILRAVVVPGGSGGSIASGCKSK